MRILGIDPGSRIIGHAIIEVIGKQIRCIDSGSRNFSKIDNFPERLHQIFLHAKLLVEEFAPDHVSLEGLIYVKSPLALIKLAQARGAMLAAFAQECPDKIFEYSPNLVKLSATGHGHASKQGMQKLLANIPGVSTFSTMDESDALAVAFCHALHWREIGVTKISSSKRGHSSLARALEHRVNEKEQK